MSFSTAAGANYWEAKTASPWFQTGRAFTVMAWVNLSSAATNFSCIASTFDGTANGWEFGAVNGDGTGAMYFGFQNTSYAGYDTVAGQATAASVWYHMCVRYGVAGLGTYDLVRNGSVLFASGALGLNVGAVSHKLRVHQSSDNAGAGMPGSTACVRMFDGALTLGEVNLNRTSVLCPPSLSARCIVDLPGTRRTDQGVPFDRGPKNLGAFGKTGTVTTSFDPPAAVFAPARRWWRAIKVAAGGTAFTGSYAGSMTASGALTKAVSKPLAGSSTAAGAMAKQTIKPLSGSSTAAGSLAKAAAKPLAGSSTAAGAMAKQAGKPLAGTTTGTGAMAKQAGKAGSGSVTGAGGLTETVGKGLAGSVTGTGAVTKAVGKPLAGSATPSGVLSNATAKLLSGSLTAAGVLTKAVAKAMAGNSTIGGALTVLGVKLITMGGSVTGIGSLVRAVAKYLAGLVTGSGSLATSGGSSSAPAVYVPGTWPRFDVPARALNLDAPARTLHHDLPRRSLDLDVPIDGVRVP